MQDVALRAALGWSGGGAGADKGSAHAHTSRTAASPGQDTFEDYLAGGWPDQELAAPPSHTSGSTATLSVDAPAAGPAAALCAWRVREAGQALLRVVLLHEAHMGGLLELCARGAVPLLHAAPGAGAAQGPRARGGEAEGEGEGEVEGDAGPEADKGDKVGKNEGGRRSMEEKAGKGSYHTLVLQVGCMSVEGCVRLLML